MKIGPYPITHRLTWLTHFCPAAVGRTTALHAARACLTEELDTFLIGSDGVNNLIDTSCAGGVETFRTDPLDYENPYAISNRLRCQMGTNRDRLAGTQEERPTGVLPDDTTLVVGRKR